MVKSRKSSRDRNQKKSVNDSKYNKFLAFLIVACILFSVGGLFVGFERLKRLRYPTVTGLITSVGRVNISVSDLTALDVIDGLIDFGVCTPPTAGMLIESNGSGTSDCSGEIFPDFITVANMGNNYINVTLKTTLSGGDQNFVGGSNATLWYTSRNTSVASGTTTNTGCLNRFVACNTTTALCDCTSEANCTTTLLWANITTANVEYIVCKNLSFEPGHKNVSVWMRLFIPSDAPVRPNRNITTIFTATRLI